ncbi:GlsB/YeaQ/YmgE family stress response membrane protein [Dysgonomonas sp. Marseille-P4677]|uniref:GlsB/YeaQ/YmgE family stress response membrane protein n=1 Tax=Dysgonomonas sp. Marseille-P4677 TaxID=2364790 RepID=UPI0019146535|nr:GlsB/YeaQ/YmgE family stress response membrane protein [Dysgonomonas sp. Marseille-P4677]MBK5722908.1 GlsB/YeaQ/YmgE family stress response membrane protein [Dysgonomonas sp. Marseille-P4677]
MEGLGILWSIIIGIAAGAIAGWIMKGRGFGIVINLIVGLVGSLLGGWIYALLGINSSGILGVLLMSVIGAVVLLWIISLFKRKP